ncbi:hypothetical protein RABR111495_24450 [Rahnella bruchi]
MVIRVLAGALSECSVEDPVYYEDEVDSISTPNTRALAARGYIVLTFGPAYQGASSGQPRVLESPADRIADLRAAVDFLIRQNQVDAWRTGMLDVCGGGRNDDRPSDKGLGGRGT